MARNKSSVIWMRPHRPMAAYREGAALRRNTAGLKLLAPVEVVGCLFGLTCSVGA